MEHAHGFAQDRQLTKSYVELFFNTEGRIMAKKRTAATKAGAKAGAKRRTTKRTVRTRARSLLDQAVAVGESVLKNIGARRARRQAAIVNAVAGGTKFAKTMNARAARRTKAAAQAKKKLKG
jgi:hypothetical protein